MLTPRQRPLAISLAAATAVVVAAVELELALPAAFGATPFRLLFAAVAFAGWYGGAPAGLLAMALSAIAGQRLLTPGHHWLPAGPAQFSQLASFVGLTTFVVLLLEQLHVVARRLRHSEGEQREEHERLQRALEELRAGQDKLAHANEQLQVQAEELEVTAEELRAQSDDLLSVERELRRQLAYVGAVTDSMLEGLYAIDVNGRCTFMNPSAERLLGWSREELLRRNVHETIHYQRGDGSPYPQEQCPSERVMHTGRALAVEDEVFTTREGIRIPVTYSAAPLMIDGRVAGAVVAFSDVTERRRDEAELRDREQRLRLAIEAGAMGTWDWEPASGRLQWSPRLEQIYGLAPGEFNGTLQAFLAAVHPDDHDRVRAEFAAPAGDTQLTRHRVRLPDGTVRWVENHGRVIHESDGRVARVVGVTLDVTDRERTRQELQSEVARSTADLRETIRELDATVEELEAFSFSVAHDLRAPLRAMHGYADEILEQERSAVDAYVRDLARRIASSAEQMDRLIQDLLSYSRLARSELEPQPIDLALALEEVLEHMRHEIRAAAIKVDVPHTLPRVLGHRATLFQVMSNLTSNAVKFVAPGVAPEISVRAELCGAAVRLWFEDNGIGIAPHHHERIFRVFERLHGGTRYPGTGVGLAIVRRGIERMGGRCGLESEPGRGSRFWIELPRADCAATPAVDGAATGARAARTRVTRAAR
ncbi:MAG TPA: PAS domain S-box protein [Candidatus Eisenbacteria bacterium]|nr:PAS domain S-box protein [Candidatus Eisenbacteria bacterium]